MQNSPAGANTNRKLGIAALQITDLSTPMHRLAETGANTNRKLGIAALQITDLSTSMHRLLEGCRP